MRRHNQHIMELADSNLSKSALTQPAINFDKADIKKMIRQTQNKHDDLYVAKFDSQDSNEVFKIIQSYDEYLNTFIDDYLNGFNDVREFAKLNFHQEMTLGYCIDECIALLHRKLENHQDKDSLVTVDKNGNLM
ncbi:MULTISPECIES: hypothetical protein [Apilactobacillus]|uniref:Uncharacterized protein n=1 Tax=Apilactobacillus micheneri TaxID=1899430 RepID=A0A9Q8IPE4_9LACO|nr:MULTISPECIES: hypothetical protein [Apilactobacillus]TPR18171.1 hypothetical protein DYZ95_02400 [Apilactobacillus timberlakei]TPR41084.1 hypothetical protein DY121_01360 [Apilactobacillus micheneri]TPR46191.1 hypothetical protein DY130_01360 [Apilactobacillus micheneri]TPR46876.1 hypothetical protein DY128_01360 [Apilactobacillus micheneri]